MIMIRKRTFKECNMNSTTTFTLVALPLAAFLVALVAMWWCLFRTRDKGGKKEKDSDSCALGIAKTASKEESVGSPSVDLEQPSAVTDDHRYGTIAEEQEPKPEPKGSPVQKVRTLLSSRWSPSEKKLSAKAGKHIWDIEEVEPGVIEVTDSINDEELTLDNGAIGNGSDFHVAPVSKRSPGRVIKKLFQNMSVVKEFNYNNNEVPNEIYSPHVNVSDTGSYPDDEITVNYLVDDMERTLTSQDVYTTA
jgi:hypothetical protein